jgi:probable F420-dependent oxidoreductase
MLRLGLNLPFSEGQMAGRTPRWADILAMAQAAEAIGFDGVWLSDHIGFGDPEGDWSGSWESWTLLTAIAASTERVTLGTYVTCAPFRNPALLAKMAETLDEVSGGRLILGLGAGWNEPEFRAYGFPFEDRFDRFEDSLRIICSMLRTGTAHHDGKAAKALGARLQPRGPRPGGLPVMVGTAGPRLLRLTAELADHWNGSLRPRAETEELLRRVDDACRAVGRDPGTLTRSVEVLVRVLPAPAGEPPDERELGGTPDEIAAQLVDCESLGIDELQVQLRPNALEAVEAFRPVLEVIRGSRPPSTGP